MIFSVSFGFNVCTKSSLVRYGNVLLRRFTRKIIVLKKFRCKFD